MRDVDNEIGRLGLIVDDNILATSSHSFISVGNGAANEFLLSDELSLDLNNLAQTVGLFITGTLGSVFKIDSIVAYCLIIITTDLLRVRKEYVRGTLNV